jgi:hypothetical protein
MSASFGGQFLLADPQRSGYDSSAAEWSAGTRSILRAAA